MTSQLYIAECDAQGLKGKSKKNPENLFLESCLQHYLKRYVYIRQIAAAYMYAMHHVCRALIIALVQRNVFSFLITFLLHLYIFLQIKTISPSRLLLTHIRLG